MVKRCKKKVSMKTSNKLTDDTYTLTGPSSLYIERQKKKEGQKKLRERKN